LLTGRLVERWNGQLGPVAELLVALGYRPDFDLPPTVALGFSAVPEPEPGDAPDA
jgi:hypothetical protein